LKLSFTYYKFVSSSIFHIGNLSIDYLNIFLSSLFFVITISLPLLYFFLLWVFFIICLIIWLDFFCSCSSIFGVWLSTFFCVSFSFRYKYALHNVIVCFNRLLSFEDFSFWTLFYFRLILFLQMNFTWAFWISKALTTLKLERFVPVH
jgi:hypothetical protein